MDKQEFDILFDELAPTQENGEFWWLVKKVQAIQPAKILEVGVATGKTLRFWQEISTQSYGVDQSVHTAGHVRDCKNPNLPAPVMITGDSHADEIIAMAEEHAPFDFCFIDGDHSYEGALQDWEVYGKMVRPGGLVGFHDVGRPNSDEAPPGRVVNAIRLSKEYIYNWVGICLVRIG